MHDDMVDRSRDRSLLSRLAPPICKEINGNYRLALVNHSGSYLERRSRQVLFIICHLGKKESEKEINVSTRTHVAENREVSIIFLCPSIYGAVEALLCYDEEK